MNVTVSTKGPTETRQIIIYGALKIAEAYCAAHRITDDDRRQFVTAVVIDEALAYWNMRPFDASERNVANRALARLDRATISQLLRDQGFRH